MLLPRARHHVLRTRSWTSAKECSEDLLTRIQNGDYNVVKNPKTMANINCEGLDTSMIVATVFGVVIHLYLLNR